MSSSALDGPSTQVGTDQKYKSKGKDLSDSHQYQTNITNLENLLIRNTSTPTIKGRPNKGDSAIISISDSSDGFYMTTLNKSLDDCHAILIYIKTDDTDVKRAYIYDPNGKEAISSLKPPLKICVCGKRVPIDNIDISMTPDTGINPEGFCALWCIVVMILWDIESELTFDKRMQNLILFNQKISGKQKIPGLRKWFITTIYHLFMKYKEYNPTIVKEQFVPLVQEKIMLLLTYTPESSIHTYVVSIAKAIDDLMTAKETTSNRAVIDRANDIYDATINDIVKASLDASAFEKLAEKSRPMMSDGGRRSIRKYKISKNRYNKRSLTKSKKGSKNFK